MIRKMPADRGRRWKLEQSPDTMVQVTGAGPAGRRCNTREDSSDGQPIYKGLEVHDGPVLLQGGRVRRPEGADPAGDRGCSAAARGAVQAGRRRDRQPASAGDEADPSDG